MPLCTTILAGTLALSVPATSWGHGFAGKRFFPATLAVDDPFISDELSFVVNHIREADQETNELSLAYSKRITPHFGIEFGDAYRIVRPNGEKTQKGFANLDLGTKYQFFTDGGHEALVSIGLNAEIGDTGSRSVGADSFSTISPAVFFGKGFGDLPEEVKYLKPLAITGAIGPNFPTRSRNVTWSADPDTGKIVREIEQNPTTLSWGFTLQYSLQYLQAYVKDVGLGTPLSRMILLVEFPFETCLNHGCSGGRTIGFVNPGVIWFGKYLQLGIEAQIPVNHQTASHVGVLGMIHVFVDDLFPKSIGRPIFP